MPTPEERVSAKEIYDKYENEPISPWPLRQVVPQEDVKQQVATPQNTVYKQQVAQIITPPTPQGLTGDDGVRTHGQEKISKPFFILKQVVRWKAPLNLKLHILKTDHWIPKKVVQSSGMVL